RRRHRRDAAADGAVGDRTAEPPVYPAGGRAARIPRGEREADGLPLQGGGELSDDPRGRPAHRGRRVVLRGPARERRQGAGLSVLSGGRRGGRRRRRERNRLRRQQGCRQDGTYYGGPAFGAPCRPIAACILVCSETLQSRSTPMSATPRPHPPVDPDGLLEFSVVYTDRSLSHMSAAFQAVMRELSGTLKEVYAAHSVAIVPGGGTYAMEAVARQFATGRRCLVLRNGWFSYRWTQIFEAGDIPGSAAVLKARRADDAAQAPFVPAPIDEVEASIRAERPDLVFAPHIETASGI